jgi:hypothetical protein
MAARTSFMLIHENIFKFRNFKNLYFNSLETSFAQISPPDFSSYARHIQSSPRDIPAVSRDIEKTNRSRNLNSSKNPQGMASSKSIMYISPSRHVKFFI